MSLHRLVPWFLNRVLAARPLLGRSGLGAEQRVCQAQYWSNDERTADAWDRARRPRLLLPQGPAIVELMSNPDGRLWVDRLTEGIAASVSRLRLRMDRAARRS